LPVDSWAIGWILEVQLAGDRLCFQRISGEGPDTGWAAGQRGRRADGEEKRGDDFGDMSDFINRDWIEKMISKPTENWGWIKHYNLATCFFGMNIQLIPA
jgi:hypothetical protein